MTISRSYPSHPDFQRLLEQIRNNQVTQLVIDAHQMMKQIKQEFFADAFNDLIKAIKQNESIKLITTFGFSDNERKAFGTLVEPRFLIPKLQVFNLLGDKHRVDHNFHIPSHYIKQKKEHQSIDPSCILFSEEPISIAIRDEKEAQDSKVSSRLIYIQDAKILPNGNLIVAQNSNDNMVNRLSVIDLKNKEVTTTSTAKVNQIHLLKNDPNKILINSDEKNSHENSKNTFWKITLKLLKEEKTDLPCGKFCELADGKYAFSHQNGLTITSGSISKHYENKNDRSTFALYPLRNGKLITTHAYYHTSGIHWKFTKKRAIQTPINLFRETYHIKEVPGNQFVTSTAYCGGLAYYQIYSTQTKQCKFTVSYDALNCHHTPNKLLNLTNQPFFLARNSSGLAILWKSSSFMLDYYGATILPNQSFSIMTSDQELMTIEAKPNEFIIHRAQLKTDENFQKYCKDVTNHMVDKLNFLKDIAQLTLSVLFGKSPDEIKKSELSIARNAFTKWKSYADKKQGSSAITHQVKRGQGTLRSSAK